MPARDLKIDPLLHHPERHGIYTVKIKITLRLYFTSRFHDDYELQLQNFCRFVDILENYRNFQKVEFRVRNRNFRARFFVLSYEFSGRKISSPKSPDLQFFAL